MKPTGSWDEKYWFFFLGYPRRYAGFYFYVSILLRWFTLRAWKSRKLNLDLIQDQPTSRHLKLKVSNYSMTKGKKCVILLLRLLNLTIIFSILFFVKQLQKKKSRPGKGDKVRKLTSFPPFIELSIWPIYPKVSLLNLSYNTMCFTNWYFLINFAFNFEQSGMKGSLILQFSNSSRNIVQFWAHSESLQLST